MVLECSLTGTFWQPGFIGYSRIEAASLVSDVEVLNFLLRQHVPVWAQASE